MEENVMIITDRLIDLYWQLVSEKEALEAKEEHVKQLRLKVVEMMGDKEIVYDCDDPGLRRALFTIVEQPDYYKVDTDELMECAPLIWESHQKLVKGNRSLRVNFRAYENVDFRAYDNVVRLIALILLTVHSVHRGEASRLRSMSLIGYKNSDKDS